MKSILKPAVGKWIIVEMEAWDQDFVNMEVPGPFTSRKDGKRHFQFGQVLGEMDCRLELDFRMQLRCPSPASLRAAV